MRPNSIRTWRDPIWWRARGQLTEIRARELRFTPTEVEDFLNCVMGLDLAGASVQHLEQMTEGWIAGLQLAGQALRGREDASELVENFGGSHRYIIEYLMEEVLKRQPAPIQSFLRQTSIPERFNAPLCAAVCADGHSENEDFRAILEYLERAKLIHKGRANCPALIFFVNWHYFRRPHWAACTKMPAASSTTNTTPAIAAVRFKKFCKSPLTTFAPIQAVIKISPQSNAIAITIIPRIAPMIAKIHQL